LTIKPGLSRSNLLHGVVKPVSGTGITWGGMLSGLQRAGILADVSKLACVVASKP
jgi:hypothetical protein